MLNASPTIPARASRVTGGDDAAYVALGQARPVGDLADGLTFAPQSPHLGDDVIVAAGHQPSMAYR